MQFLKIMFLIFTSLLCLIRIAAALCTRHVKTLELPTSVKLTTLLIIKSLRISNTPEWNCNITLEVNYLLALF